MRVELLTAAVLLVPLAFQDPQDVAKKPAGPEIGKPAPAIRLNDHLGRAVQVGGEAKTWTVLACSPKAATRG